jgi:hypothetical protein
MVTIGGPAKSIDFRLSEASRLTSGCNNSVLEEEESRRDYPVRDRLQPMDHGTEDEFEFEDDYEWGNEEDQVATLNRYVGQADGWILFPF